MAEAVVSFTLEKLYEWLKEEGAFLYGVGGNVEQLKDELIRMKSFLKDADSRQLEDASVRNWVASIREAAYDAEDIIETYLLEVASKRGGNCMNLLKRILCVVNELKTRQKVGSEINRITSSFSDIANSMQRYGIRGVTYSEGSLSSAQERQRERRRTFGHYVEPNLVGVGAKVEQIVTDLTDEKKNLRVLSIWGMGGLGKTTIAKKVFHHQKVRRHFDLFAWTFVSQQCNQGSVWQEIFQGLTSEKGVTGMMEAELAGYIYKIFEEYKCLVVIDDIWTQDDWDHIKQAFPIQTVKSLVYYHVFELTVFFRIL